MVFGVGVGVAVHVGLGVDLLGRRRWCWCCHVGVLLFGVMWILVVPLVLVFSWVVDICVFHASYRVDWCDVHVGVDVVHVARLSWSGFALTLMSALALIGVLVLIRW